MTDCVKIPHTAIFTGPTGFGKTRLALDLIEKEYNKRFCLHHHVSALRNYSLNVVATLNPIE